MNKLDALCKQCSTPIQVLVGSSMLCVVCYAKLLWRERHVKAS